MVNLGVRPQSGVCKQSDGRADSRLFPAPAATMGGMTTTDGPATAANRRWTFAPHDGAAAGRLARELQCSTLLAQVLAARGVTGSDEARVFLNNTLQDLNDPSEMPGLDEAADAVVAAVRGGRRVTIWGDYDVDGVTATSLLWHCLRLADARVDYYIPSRLEEGYGLNAEAVRKLHEEDPERLIVTVDCGASAVAEVRLAAELGLEIIVTDHHKFGPELPGCLVVHPRRGDATGTDPDYPGGDLCGAGVAFKLAWGLCKRLGDGERASPAMREYLIAAVGLAAMGTIADCVPLVKENRVIATHGLKALKGRLSEGMKALKQVSGVEPEAILSSETVSFGMAPRINAAGRLGQARLAVELLTTEDPARAAQLAAYIDQLNEQRKTVERKILKQAKELVEDRPDWAEAPMLVLAHEDWHPGVIGIVASRVAEHYNRPAVLIALDPTSRVGQGSGRSMGLVDLHAALTACREHLVGYGGHAAAAGLRVDLASVDALREALCGEASRQFTTPDSSVPVIELAVDAEVSLSELSHRAVREMDRLGPFGQANERPLLCASGVTVMGEAKTMGGGDRHFTARFTQGGKGIRAVAFGRGEWAKEMAGGGPFDIVFAAQINAFRGHENVEMRLMDWRPAA